MASPPPANTDADRAADGRRRRSQDSRARIVRALLDLVQAGEHAPAAEQVAVRADVGLRTVFRHFSDMDSLYREMSGAVEAELQALLAEPLRGATWRERVMELVRRRAAVYEKIAPFRRASDVHRHDSPYLAADHTRFITIARDLLRAQLPAEVARDPLAFETLDLLLSFEVWSRLRNDQGLSVERALDVVATLVRREVG